MRHPPDKNHTALETLNSSTEREALEAKSLVPGGAVFEFHPRPKRSFLGHPLIVRFRNLANRRISSSLVSNEHIQRTTDCSSFHT
jgi:hypothetical protein